MYPMKYPLLRWAFVVLGLVSASVARPVKFVSPTNHTGVVPVIKYDATAMSAAAARLNATTPTILPTPNTYTDLDNLEDFPVINATTLDSRSGTHSAVSYEVPTVNGTDTTGTRVFFNITDTPTSINYTHVLPTTTADKSTAPILDKRVYVTTGGHPINPKVVVEVDYDTHKIPTLSERDAMNTGVLPVISEDIPAVNGTDLTATRVLFDIEDTPTQIDYDHYLPAPTAWGEVPTIDKRVYVSTGGHPVNPKVVLEVDYDTHTITTLSERDALNTGVLPVVSEDVAVVERDALNTGVLPVISEDIPVVERDALNTGVNPVIIETIPDVEGGVMSIGERLVLIEDIPDVEDGVMSPDVSPVLIETIPVVEGGVMEMGERSVLVEDIPIVEGGVMTPGVNPVLIETIPVVEGGVMEMGERSVLIEDIPVVERSSGVNSKVLPVISEDIDVVAALAALAAADEVMVRRQDGCGDYIDVITGSKSSVCDHKR